MAVSGKVAVLFGGARGIGEACVERLLREGAKVIHFTVAMHIRLI